MRYYLHSSQVLDANKIILDTSNTSTTDVSCSLCPWFVAHHRFLDRESLKEKTVAHTTALKGGHVSVVMRRFELIHFLNTAEKYQINELMVVPPIAIAIIMSGVAGDKLRSIKHAGVGAAPMGKEPQEKLKKLFAPGATMTQAFGMTETSCICAQFWFWEDDTTGSVGRMLPNIDAKYAFLPLYCFNVKC